MTTYRTGNHHGVTIVAEGDGARCGRPGHDCERGHLVAVVVDGSEDLDSMELAERICHLLSAEKRVIQRLDAAYCADCDLRMMRGTPHPHPLVDVQVTVTEVEEA